MKPRSLFILLFMALCWIALPASASRLGDIRVHARFLTDRMAYELRLSSRQYNDIFEINYDFFYNVEPYIDRMSYGDSYALDMYYRYLDERNDDIRWVLSRRYYKRFMSLEYFFLPIYSVNRVCYVRIYNIYPNRTHFYYGRPSHYFTYRGGHCRHHYGGVSFYQTNYRKHYRHSVYNGNYRSVRTSTRGRDFPSINHRDNIRTESVVPRPVRSERKRTVSGTSESVKHQSGSVRRRTETIRHRSESAINKVETPHVRPIRYDNNRHRIEASSTRSGKRENLSQRTTRKTVRHQSTEVRGRNQADCTRRSERSERRVYRDR